MCPYPSIDLAATGRNIARLRKAQGLTVRALQAYFGFDDPQAIYRWQWGRSLPSVDNLYALSVLFGVSMNEILVPIQSIQHENEQQAEACCSAVLWDMRRFLLSLLYRENVRLSLNRWFKIRSRSPRGCHCRACPW